MREPLCKSRTNVTLTLTLRDGMCARRRSKSYSRSEQDDASSEKVRCQSGVSVPAARPHHSHDCSPGATSCHLSSNASGHLLATRQVVRKAANPLLRSQRNSKMGHSRRRPSARVGHTKIFAAHPVSTPIFATRSIGSLIEGSLKRSDMTC